MEYPGMILCPSCKHPVSEHYGGCMVVVQENCDGPDETCDCTEHFNLANNVRYPNHHELIELLERAADALQDYRAERDSSNDPLATEIRKKLAGEL